MFSKPQKQMLGPYCSWCYSVNKLSRCSRCSNAYYCCREHQVQHWKIHRDDCIPSSKMNQQNENSVLSNQLSIGNDSIDVLSEQTTHMQATNVVQPKFPENVQSQFSSDIQNQFAQDVQAQFSSLVPQQTYSSWLSGNISESQTSSSPSNVIYSSEQVSPDVYTNSECFLSPEITTAVHAASGNTNLDNFYTSNLLTLDDALFVENNDLFSSLTSELLNSQSNYWDIINNYNSIENVNFTCDLDINNSKQHIEEKVVDSDLNFIPTSSLTDVEEVEASIENHKPEKILLLEDVCQNVVHDLNEYGICVIDDFLGSKVGNFILTEVKRMFLKGLFKRGEVVSSSMACVNEIIRNDVITWVNGTEKGCAYIGYLIRKLDLVIAGCNKMPDNGILKNYKLNGRTHAMIACYPGDGTYYRRHIDNPNKDGRCITCIYYLNKNWDVKAQGGLLRMFPAGHQSEVANIDPIFDRMLFFWSDKRNPHEVLPSFDVRFAITVWYFDAEERTKALQENQSQKYT